MTCLVDDDQCVGVVGEAAEDVGRLLHLQGEGGRVALDRVAGAEKGENH